MNCKKCKEILPLFILQELSPGEKELTEAHLQVCPDCRAEFVQVEKILNNMKENPPEIAVPENYYSHLITNIHHRVGHKKVKFSRFLIPVFPVFITVLILAVLVFSPFKKKDNILNEDLNLYTFDLSSSFLEDDSLSPAVTDSDFKELQEVAILYLLSSGDFPQNMDEWVDLISDDQYNTILASLEKIE